MQVNFDQSGPQSVERLPCFQQRQQVQVDGVSLEGRPNLSESRTSVDMSKFLWPKGWKRVGSPFAPLDVCCCYGHFNSTAAIRLACRALLLNFKVSGRTDGKAATKKKTLRFTGESFPQLKKHYFHFCLAGIWTFMNNRKIISKRLMLLEDTFLTWNKQRARDVRVTTSH